MNDITTEPTLCIEPRTFVELSPPESSVEAQVGRCSPPDQPEQYQGLDYVNSDDAAEIDMGIRDTIMGIRLSILTMGLGLAKIKSKGFFKALGFRSMLEYIDSLSTETKMNRSSIYNWLNIGEAFIKYKAELEQIGFSENDGPTKLPYLERALAFRQKEEVFDNIKNMSLREFIDFAKGGKPEPLRDVPYIINKGSVIYIRGKKAIIVNKNLGRRTTNYFMKVVGVACEALEKGGYIMPVFLRSKRETKRFNRSYKRIMEEVRSG